MQNGNYREAYDGFRGLALRRDGEADRVGQDLEQAIACLVQLNRQAEIDAFRDQVIEVHQDNWRLLWTAARTYLAGEHYGYMIAGQFQRGPHRGGGAVFNAQERDRVRALQLMAQAVPLARQDEAHGLVSDFLLDYAGMWIHSRGYTAAWMLQDRTDLETLPDYEPGWGGRYFGETQGAPVDGEGNPVFYTVPESFDAAENDGQRWRWCLEQAVEFNVARRFQTRLTLANFLHEQFGVQTMAAYGFFFGRMNVDDTQETQSGIYALHTLGKNETIARLATGVKRFELPDEFNFIQIFEDVAASNTPWAEQAIGSLASLYENRRQYPEAANWYREGLRRFPRNEHWKRQLGQIENNWGQFEPTIATSAGDRARFEYRFRNAGEVTFEAHSLDVEKLLNDVKAYISAKPRQLDWNRLQLDNIGYRIVIENQKEYLKDQVARWTLALDPRPNHFDRRVTVETPLEKAGAYLIKAEVKGGNTSYIIVWLDDLAIAQKPMDNRDFYYVADAKTGAPVAKAHLEFFGWRQQHRGGPDFEVTTQRFAEYTDVDGQLILSPAQQAREFQWLVTARSEDGRFAYLGFRNVWYRNQYDPDYEATRIFTITDRPVYRPKQTAHYKFWARHAKYDMGNVSQFAGVDAVVEIHDPRGQRVVQRPVKLDEYGGIEGDLELEEDAPLGVWQVQLRIGNHLQGGGSFRVEEYKKPEFEVTVDAPSEPVMLGEKVTATVKAKYYFGEPVRVGTVKYTVKRTPYSDQWYPVRPWDWFYGPGYWWFAYDYDWYPGWRGWGCPRPMPVWWHRPSSPPEVVSERTVAIGDDGTLEIEIDTELAKIMHPHRDHKYEITVEVTDASRRVIVGSGSVLVAREPFKVFAWADRGHYRAGEVIQANFQARTLDGKPVAGSGVVDVYHVRFAEGKPLEQKVYSQELDPNSEGQAELRLRAVASGQYRVAYTLTDRSGHTIEGAQLLTVRGVGDDTRNFRFNAIELIPEKAEYAPGETVRLQVNTNQSDGTVLLFVRPTSGVYTAPQVLRIDGKSTVVDLGVTQRDMPNFFVEAMTIFDGKVYNDVKEIVVPPEKRILNVEVIPSSDTYRPGEKATVEVRLTELNGEPFVGSTVLTVYDKSVEYIAGGSNVEDIKEFFWKWRRNHNPVTISNLERRFHELVERNVESMAFLGVFGQSVADDLDTVETGMEVESLAMNGGGGFGGGLGGARSGRTFSAMADGAAPAMPMAAMAPMAEGMAMAADASAKAAPAPNGGDQPAFVEATVRSNFADTALWVGSLTTEKDGRAEVTLDMPENLTTWRIKVWGMGHGTRVGEGQAEVITRKGLILRMQTPRFFVQTDEVVLSANVHNYLESEKLAQISLELDGSPLHMIDEAVRTVRIEAGKEVRIDWRVKVVEPGEVVVRMKALTDEESDAMEMTLPAFVHGMLKMEAVSGSIRPDEESGRFTIRVPSERRPEETRLEVRYSPTLAGAMVDALPYLLDYPYGCTEQTLNRFLPAVITQKILIDMGIDLAKVRNVRTNLNAQELGEHDQRAAQWQRYKVNPVFDQIEMTKIVKEGVNRLTEMQCADGGWGWFSGYGERSTPHTTAVVVHGLQVARANDVALVPGVLERGVAWLERHQAEQVRLLQIALLPEEERKGKRYKTQADDTDALVYMILVDAEKKNDTMRDFLYRDRTKNSVYALSMLGLALEKQGEQEMLDMVLRNIGQYLVVDDENQTAWLHLPSGGYWWCWYGSEFETHAYYLKLLAKTDPKGDLAPKLVKYLLNNRKHATYWNSTRDTALCVEAMADFLVASGENKPDMTVEVWYNGELKQAVEITSATLFQFNNAFVLEGTDVADGEHAIELRKKGTGPLYYNGYLTNFTLEDPIAAAGLEIKVQRKYYKLVLDEDATAAVAGSRGQVIHQRVEKYVRVPLADLSTLKSGDLVEIELEIESKNDYESLVFEDMKPAGFEPVEIRSGYNGNAMGAYVEFRDNRVVFFVHRLARGTHGVAYRMRAEVPGSFSALPTKGWAMYAPELKANSDEFKVKVED